jgi:effector-binding domain-containing protein
MIETPEIIDVLAQQAAVIHVTVPRAQISEVMGPAIHEVMSAIAAQGIAPAGPIFSHHLRLDPGVFDFELGVPVTDPVAATGRVKPGRLPATRIARTVYHGPYERLGDAWGEFGEWLSTQGLTPAQDLWESYLTGPESGDDPSKWRTELNRPLAGGAGD